MHFKRVGLMVKPIFKTVSNEMPFCFIKIHLICESSIKRLNFEVPLVQAKR